MVNDSTRWDRLLSKYPNDADILAMSRRHFRRVGRDRESGQVTASVIQQLCDAWHEVVGCYPTVGDPVIRKRVQILIDQHGAELVAQRLVAGIRARQPGFLWRDGVPALSTVIGQFDAMATVQESMTPGDLFAGGFAP